jgi:hypothetical protein
MRASTGAPEFLFYLSCDINAQVRPICISAVISSSQLIKPVINRHDYDVAETVKPYRITDW